MPSGAAQEKLPLTLLPNVAQPFNAANAAVPMSARTIADWMHRPLTTWRP